MKYPFMIALAAILAANLVSAQSYFYGDYGPMNIEPDSKSQVIHFSNSADYQAFLKNTPSEFEVVKQLVKYDAVIIQSNRALPTDLSVFPEFEHLQIKNQVPVFRLDDGYGLWLGYEMLFEPKPGFENQVNSFIENAGGKIKINQYGMFRAELSAPLATLSLSNELVETGMVNWAHPNFYANHQKASDPEYPDQFQMHNTGQNANGVTGLADIDCDAPEAWAISTGSSSIIVAVIDDGVEDHEDIEDDLGNSRILSGHTPANNGDGTPVGSNSHGMACAGIIAASHNDIGVRGVAPGVNILPIDIFEGSETTADLADAYNWALTQGADVLSNSWGYNSCSLSLSALSSAINNARNNGRGGLGCVIVFASGNRYGNCVDYPADLSYVMAVGAVTNLGALSNYSNEGPTLDIVAPSNAAPGQTGAGVSTTDRPGFAGYSSGNYTSSFGGTSAACPLVAGVAALVLSVDPSMEEDDVRNLLEDTATDMGASGFDNSFGHGRVNAHEALMNLAPADCSISIIQMPYSESFESGLGGWSQGNQDDLNWIQNSGSTPSSNTGAASAFDGNDYLFVEASSPNFPSKDAVLTSPCFDISGLNSPSFSLAYHMYGAAMGTLQIEAKLFDDASWTTIQSISGNQGNNWTELTVDLSGFAGATNLQIRISGLTGTGYTSDICIDALNITEGTVEICSSVISSMPYYEGFESSATDWSQSTDDDLNWTRKTGSTTSNNTGPSSAVEGSYYMYIESSSPNYPSKTGQLNSPCFDISSLNTPALTFNYHMYGAATGTLLIEGKLAPESNWNTLFTISDNQGDTWLEANIDLSAYAGATDLQLRISGTTGTSYTGDIAIDGLGLDEYAVTVSCPSTIDIMPYSEGFENTSSDWIQSSNDDLDWIRKTGSTPSSNTGPSNAAEGTYYMYIEASSPNYPSKTGQLTSPCFDISSLTVPALEFSYHMFGVAMGSLIVEAKLSTESNWNTIFTASGNQGNSWLEANIDLVLYAGATDLQLRITGNTGTSFTSDISIDGLKIIEYSGTSCDASISNFPYSEGFESTSYQWNQSIQDDLNWVRKTGTTSSSGTGPASASEGNYYLYIEASSPNFPAKSAILESDCFDFSSTSSANISFDYNMYGANMGSLSLETKIGDGAWVPLWIASGDQGNNWLLANIDISGFAGESEVKLRFKGVTGLGYKSDIAIDDINITSSGTTSNDCPTINFNSFTVDSYGGSQDEGLATVSPDGSELSIVDNAWKSIAMNYTVTANTMISFEFRSTAEGEIHGIGFDNDANISNQYTFQVHGTQNWGILTYNNYTGSSWTSYVIPVGSAYTGNFNRLIFVGDNDSGPAGENSHFRNVKVYENGDCDISASLNNHAAIQEFELGTEKESESAIEIYPNPTTGDFILNLSKLKSTEVRVINLTGKILKTEVVTANSLQLSISDLANGIYMIQVLNGEEMMDIQKIVKSN